MESSQKDTHNYQQRLNDLLQQSIELLQYGKSKVVNNTNISDAIANQNIQVPSEVSSECSQSQEPPIIESIASLDTIAREILICDKCSLCSTRKNSVPGVGVKKPLLMIIGEAPGQQEDEQGQPFVGPSGKYLDQWLAAIHLSRETNVFITNTVKCRPPHNRDPHDDEVASCNAYLKAQIALCKPKMLLALGKIAGHILTGNPTATLGQMRKQEYTYADIPLRVTYHPSAVLRNQNELKPLVWEDLKAIQAFLEI